MDPICAASIIRDYSTDVVYFSNAAHPTQRIRMTVKRSEDFAKTWKSELLVYEGTKLVLINAMIIHLLSLILMMILMMMDRTFCLFGYDRFG